MLFRSYFFSGPPEAPKMQPHYLWLSTSNMSPGFDKIHHGSGAGAVWMLKSKTTNPCQKNIDMCPFICDPLFLSNGWCLEVNLCIFSKSIERTLYECFSVFVAPKELSNHPQNVCCYITWNHSNIESKPKKTQCPPKWSDPCWKNNAHLALWDKLPMTVRGISFKAGRGEWNWGGLRLELSPAKSTCQKYKLLTQYRCASTACWLILILAPEKRGGNRGGMSTVS